MDNYIVELKNLFDIIIITSPICESIKSYMYRLSNLFFNNMKLDLYSIYIKGTMEQRLLEKKELANNHNVKNANTDEIFSDFIVSFRGSDVKRSFHIWYVFTICS